MQSKRNLVFYILIFLSFFTPQHFFAQSKEPFSQSLKWQEDSNSSKYKVEVKNLNTLEVKTYTVTKAEVDVNLAAGTYEYRVTPYDFLGREGQKSEWREFTVLKAVKPQIEELQNQILDIKENTTIPILITGIEEKSKVSLINADTKEELEGKLEITSKGENLESLNAEFTNLKEGKWQVKVTNPSGLESLSNSFVIEDKARLEAEAKAREEAEKKALEEAQKLAEKKALEEERLAKERALEEERLALQKQKLEEAQRRKDEIAKREAEALERERKQAELMAQNEAELNRRKALQQKREEERKATQEALEKTLAEETSKNEEKNQIAKPDESLQTEPVEEVITEEKTETVTDPLEEKLAEEKEERKLYWENKKMAEFNVQYATGVLFCPYESKIFSLSSQKFIPAFKIDLSYLPFTIGKLNLGGDIKALVSYISGSNDDLSYTFPFADFTLNLAAWYKIKDQKYYISAKAGAGVTLYNIDLYYAWDNTRKEISSKFYGFFCASAETSFVFLPIKPVTMEIGLDFTHTFIEEMPTSTITPFLTVGVRF